MKLLPYVFLFEYFTNRSGLKRPWVFFIIKAKLVKQILNTMYKACFQNDIWPDRNLCRDVSTPWNIFNILLLEFGILTLFRMLGIFVRTHKTKIDWTDFKGTWKWLPVVTPTPGLLSRLQSPSTCENLLRFHIFWSVNNCQCVDCNLDENVTEKKFNPDY